MVSRRELFALDSDERRDVRFVKLERVRDQVLEELPHLQRVCVDRWELTDLYFSTALLEAHLKIVDHFGDDHSEVARLERLRAAGHAGGLQQVLNQRLHPTPAILR